MNHYRTRTLLVLAWSIGPFLACSNGSVNIGNTDAIGSQLSDYTATWDGYAEAYTFTPDGSDHVRLTIPAHGQATLEVGNTSLLPPPTDPNVGYPGPGQPDPIPGNPNVMTPLAGGVLFPLYALTVQESRIQAGLKPNDYYAAWCALQTPYEQVEAICYGPPVVPGADGGPSGDGGLDDDGGLDVSDTIPGCGGRPGMITGIVYKCLPGNGAIITGTGTNEKCEASSIDGGLQTVDCGKFALCGTTCACTASSCTAGPVLAAGAIPSDYPVELDGALDTTGKTLTGTLALSTNLRVTVVLTKQ